MTFNMYSLKSFYQLDLNELEQQAAQSEIIDQYQLNNTDLQSTNQFKPNADLQINMENPGNLSIFTTYSEVEKYKLKQTENTTILIAKSTKYQETETLTIFKRIYQKIISSYLKQISSQDRKPTQKKLEFQCCDFYSDLHLEISVSTLSQIINRTDFQFSQKCQLIEFFENYPQLKRFLTQTLSKGFQQINNEFIYLIKMLVDELKPCFFQQQNLKLPETKVKDLMNDQRRTGENMFPQPKLRKKSVSTVQKQEKSMKRFIDDNQFLDKVYFDKRLKYLNCREITLGLSDQKIKDCFHRFTKLYTHLIVKLMSVEAVLKASQSNTNSLEKQKPKLVNPSCEYIGSWFLANSCAKSFNSINSLTSINLNNINDVKIYNSKPDLWSEDQQQNCDNFSDDEECIGRKKRKC